jgi:hypothetical protein
MFTQSDKAWVAGLVAWAGQYLSTKFGLSFITPELVAAVVGVLTYWVPNKQT